MFYIPNYCIHTPEEYIDGSSFFTGLNNVFVGLTNGFGPLGEFICTLVFYLIIISIIITILFFLKGYGIYKLSKKTGLSNAYFSWIPILQTYQFVKLSGKNINWVYPLVFGYIALFVGGFLINIYITYSFSKKFNKGWGGFLLLLIIPSIYLNILKFENIKTKEKFTEL